MVSAQIPISTGFVVQGIGLFLYSGENDRRVSEINDFRYPVELQYESACAYQETLSLVPAVYAATGHRAHSRSESMVFRHGSGRWYRQLEARSVAWRQEDGYRIGMILPTKPSYAGYRFPPEVISHAIWLYFRFPLSLRMVEEMLAARGILVSHETVRQWVLKFGQAFANQIRRRLPQAGDKWHLDEVVITIAGKKHWLWRVVDQDGIVLDVLVQSRRDKHAAKRLLRKLLKRQGQPPRVLITDKLASSPAAKKELMPGVEHRRHKGLNNRAENSHQPTRRRERQMKRFKSPGQAQRFLSAHDQINNLFPLCREHVPATDYRAARTRAFELWAEITGSAAAA